MKHLFYLFYDALMTKKEKVLLRCKAPLKEILRIQAQGGLVVVAWCSLCKKKWFYLFIFLLNSSLGYLDLIFWGVYSGNTVFQDLVIYSWAGLLLAGM